MIIGINAVAAFTRPRTGVEEYTYQLIKHLAMLEEAKKHRFVLYTDPRVGGNIPLKDNFEIKELNWGFPGWTQVRLASEMVANKPDLLLIPVHVLPLIHPRNSVVVLHGLEFEYHPECYPKKHAKYLRWITKYALKNANKVIAVSENTKEDLIELYDGDPDRIHVVHHGIGNPKKAEEKKDDPYILYLGRLETKKNIQGIVRSFELLKKKYQVPHKLILAGSKGHGYDSIHLCNDVVEKGYVSEKEKWQLLKNAEMFVFPTFYEGFGMPILEAQISGCPVITSDISSMPEVAGEGAVLVEPRNTLEICDRMYQVIEDREFRKRLINDGFKNAKKFSWQKCAEETFKILIE